MICIQEIFTDWPFNKYQHFSGVNTSIGTKVYLFHFRSLDIVIPRYLAESVIGEEWSWRVEGRPGRVDALFT